MLMWEPFLGEVACDLEWLGAGARQLQKRLEIIVLQPFEVPPEWRLLQHDQRVRRFFY
jgi:hypothetical protein